MPSQPKNKSGQYPRSRLHKKINLIKYKKQKFITPEKAGENLGSNAFLLTGLLENPDIRKK